MVRIIVLLFALSASSVATAIAQQPTDTPAAQAKAVDPDSVVYHVGGSIKPPTVTYSVDPKYTQEARKKKFSGIVKVYLWVEADGRPSHVRVVRGVGMGLDENAVDSVRQYKFKPATKNGTPVRVDLYIYVNFQIF